MNRTFFTKLSPKAATKEAPVPSYQARVRTKDLKDKKAEWKGIHSHPKRSAPQRAQYTSAPETAPYPQRSALGRTAASLRHAALTAQSVMNEMEDSGRLVFTAGVKASKRQIYSCDAAL